MVHWHVRSRHWHSELEYHHCLRKCLNLIKWATAAR
jgi:hypothetical protein